MSEIRSDIEWYESDLSDVEDEDIGIIEYEITSAPNDFNIKTIFDFIESGVVKIPGFQRNYVWDKRRASKLIESIIIGIPIPQIFLYEQGRNQHLVIDGQQRLMSIYYFIQKRFPRKESRVELRKIFNEEGRIPEKILFDDGFFSDFNLELISKIPDKPNKLNKLNYATLGEHKSTFDLRTIRNIIVRQTSPPEDDSAVYEIFNRLNSGGVNLKPQEIRSSLYHSDFYELLTKINLDERWRRLIGLDNPDLHLKDIEIILRALAILLEEYKPSMTRFLNTFSKHCMNLSQAKLDYIEKLFYSFLDSCSDLPNDAFVSKNRKFYISLFDAVFIAAAARPAKDSQLIEKKIETESLQKLKTDSVFLKASQYETLKKPNVEKRMERANKLIKLA